MSGSLIATTPSAMALMGEKLTAWVDEKLARLDGEEKDANALLAQLRIARAATTHANRLLDSVRRRRRFYDKVRAALAAGYYIVPPMDCEVFALRTDRELPPMETSTQWWRQQPGGIPALAPGEGRYVSPLPKRSHDHTEERNEGNGQKRMVKYWSNDEWGDVEFPVRAMKPALIEATRAAMELMIFDSLGIAPAQRAADPMILGRIKHYNRAAPHLTFFIAWWMDMDDL